MKRIVILLVCTYLHCNLNAQCAKGDLVTGMYAGFSRQLDSKQTTQLAFNHNLGVTVMNKLNTGLFIGYSYNNNNLDGNYRNKGFNTGPYARYYFMNKAKYAMHAQASAVWYLYNTTNYGIENSDQKFLRNSVSFTVAPVYRLHERILLEWLHNFNRFYWTNHARSLQYTTQIGLQVIINT